jgi:hypothetical protein
MTSDTLERRLAKLGAPLELCDWARRYADLPSAWVACERGDWLAWLAVRLAGTDAERRAAARATAACARLALPYLRVPDGRLTAAIEAPRWPPAPTPRRPYSRGGPPWSASKWPAPGSRPTSSRPRPPTSPRLRWPCAAARHLSRSGPDGPSQEPPDLFAERLALGRVEQLRVGGEALEEVVAGAASLPEPVEMGRARRASGRGDRIGHPARVPVRFPAREQRF